MDDCKAVFCEFVADYWQDNSWVNLTVVSEALLPIQLSLNYHMITPSSINFMIWIGTSSSHLFVASIVFLMKSSSFPLLSRLKLGLKTLFQKWIFSFGFFKKKVLTIDNLCQWGFMLPNRCYLCLKEENMVSYISLHCVYTHEVWKIILLKWNLCWVFPFPVQDFFLQWIFPSITKSLRFFGLISFHTWFGVCGKK